MPHGTHVQPTIPIQASGHPLYGIPDESEPPAPPSSDHTATFPADGAAIYLGLPRHPPYLYYFPPCERFSQTKFPDLTRSVATPDPLSFFFPCSFNCACAVGYLTPHA